MIKVSPLTQKKIRHFKEIKRGYWSFCDLIYHVDSFTICRAVNQQ